MKLNKSKAAHTVDVLCRNAGIEFGLRKHEIAEAVSRWNFSDRIDDALKIVGHDPSASRNHVLMVHEAFAEARSHFNRQYGLEVNRKKSVVGKQLPFLLFSILLGEGDVQLAGRCKESTEGYASEFRDDLGKALFDLRHALFVHEDFAVPDFKGEPVPRVQLCRKYIANAEYCAEKTPFRSRSYYKSAKFLVAVAGAYFDAAITSITSYGAGLETTPEEVDGLVSAVENAAIACNDARVPSGLRAMVQAMCRRASGELVEYEVAGFADYAARLKDAEVPMNEMQAKRAYRLGKKRSYRRNPKKGERR